MRKYPSTIEKAKKIQELVDQHYEPGRQDRCKLWVLRNVISKIYPMSERTFYRYVNMKTDEQKKEDEDKQQLKLF